MVLPCASKCTKTCIKRDGSYIYFEEFSRWEDAVDWATRQTKETI